MHFCIFDKMERMYIIGIEVTYKLGYLIERLIRLNTGSIVETCGSTS